MKLRALTILTSLKTIVFVALCAVSGAGVGNAETVTVFAAASLKTALDEIAKDFEDATHHAVDIAYASSSALARQIQLGAPADVFISANARWMDVLQEYGDVADGSRIDLLSNELVLVGRKDAPIDLNASAILEELSRGPLAMGGVESVPVGIYGRQAFSSLGLWGAVEGHVAQTDNARAALALVALGEAQLGVVYASDAFAEPRVFVRAEFSANTHDPITYPIAALKQAKPVAYEWMEFIKSRASLDVFRANGFGVAVQ